jgi:hypothetical protein
MQVSQAEPLAALTQTSFARQWQQGPFTQDKGAPIAESSPMVATLDGDGSVVVGDRTGNLFAFHLSNGSAVPGWPVNDGGPPIDSTPSVVAQEGSAMLGGSALGSVFVGAGNAEYPHNGGYLAYSPNGAPLWDTKVVDPGTDAHPAYGVPASLTVADLQARTPDVFAGSLDQESYALNAANGSTLSGWPLFSADSVFSTAAAADLYGTSQTELVVGGASTKGFALGQIYAAGGHLRILDSRGGLICSHATDQEVDPSPAVGGFLPGGAVGIAVGTGSYYPRTSDTNVLDAFNSTCSLVWSDTLDGFTGSSPALADVQGNGSLDVVEGTDNGITGDVWLLDGATGAVIWHSFVDGRVLGSVVTADLTGNGYQDILVPTTQGVEVLDGMNGIELALLGQGLGFQNSPLVTDDPNGTIGVTVAGYNRNNEGLATYFGSLVSRHLTAPIVGIASTPDGNGYWLVASNGGVFAFGDANLPGTMVPKHLNAPIVSITPDVSTGGYWLTAADGGVFNFNAPFEGSTGNTKLNERIAGMASTADGEGYWLVAADGGVFAFGDAPFVGSMGSRKLNSPVVSVSGYCG